MVRVLVWLVAVFALVAAPAQAAKRPSAMQNARAVANTIWKSPCEGRWTVRYDEDMSFVGWSDRAACQVVLAPWLKQDREALCHVVAHEVGHLAGVEHNDNPRSIMFDGWDGDHIDPRCRARRVRSR